MMTFAAFFQTLRLFGGQLGITVMQRFIFVRQTFHQTMLARHVEAGDALTEERLRALASSMLPGSAGTEESQGRALVEVVSEMIRQAYTLTYKDGFLLIGWVCAGMVLLFACMRPMRIHFDVKQPAPGVAKGSPGVAKGSTCQSRASFGPPDGDRPPETMPRGETPRVARRLLWKGFTSDGAS